MCCMYSIYIYIYTFACICMIMCDIHVLGLGVFWNAFALRSVGPPRKALQYTDRCLVVCLYSAAWQMVEVFPRHVLAPKWPNFVFPPEFGEKLVKKPGAALTALKVCHPLWGCALLPFPANSCVGEEGDCQCSSSAAVGAECQIGQALPTAFVRQLQLDSCGPTEFLLLPVRGRNLLPLLATWQRLSQMRMSLQAS